MNTISTVSASLSAGMIQDHQLITFNKKQVKQIQIIKESAAMGDLLDVATSKDKPLANMALSLFAHERMTELVAKYMDSNNPSALVRWINIQIGTKSIPVASAKKVDFANYESNISFWVEFNSSGEPNTPKTAETRANAVAWMTPIFAAIKIMNTVTEPTTESIQG